MDATFLPHQTQNLYLSSTCLSYDPFSDENYYLYHNDDDLYHNHNSNNTPQYLDPVTFPPLSCQDSWNIPMTTNTSCILADTITNCLPETHHFHDNVLLGDTLNGKSMNDGAKISLRVKTKLQVLDDGYRWRKYGKKKLKTTPNLRNYYKCSTIGCKVKKRVEQDSGYLIATYIGIHNHQPVPSPCTNCLTNTMQFSS